MSGARRETDPRRFGAKEIHGVQDPLEPVLIDMFGRLCNAKISRARASTSFNANVNTVQLG